MIHFRPTEPSDADFLWALRTEPEIADTWWSPIPTERVKWLAATLLQRGKWHPYIVVGDGFQMGRVAFEEHVYGYEFSIGLIKEFRDQGWGQKVIVAAYEFAAWRNWLPLVATIKPNNIRSQKAFAKCGFEKKELWVCTRNPLAIVS